MQRHARGKCARLYALTACGLLQKLSNGKCFMKYLLIIAISIVSLFVQACEAQPKLPTSMPDDFHLRLTENKAGTRTIYITQNELVVISGSGFHNHKSERFTVSRDEVEKIYASLIENKIDQIKQAPKTNWGDEPSSEYKLEIRYKTNYLWLKKNPPAMTSEEQIRFDNISLAVSDFAEKRKLDK